MAGFTTITSTPPIDQPTDTVEIFDLTTPATTWVTTTSFPLAFAGSRGVTLQNIFYVTGRRRPSKLCKNWIWIWFEQYYLLRFSPTITLLSCFSAPCVWLDMSIFFILLSPRDLNLRSEHRNYAAMRIKTHLDNTIYHSLLCSDLSKTSARSVKLKLIFSHN